MPTSSNDCAAFSLEWRPSRIEALLVFVCFVLAGVAAAYSGLAAWLCSFGFALLAAAWLAAGVLSAWRIGRRGAETLMLDQASCARLHAASGQLMAAGQASLHEQWPVLVLRFQESATSRVFWPDTLTASGRRRLVLWSRRVPPASFLPQFWTG